MIAVLLALALTQAPTVNPRFLRFTSRAEPGRSDRGFDAGQQTLDQALQAGDLVGAWWAMKGDGTMKAGSAVTLVATGTPTNTTENGYPVRTYTAAQNDQEPSNVAFPASDFSICTFRRSVAAAVGAEMAAFGTAGAPASSASIPFEKAVAGAITAYASNGATFTTETTAASVLVAGTWQFVCYTYQRVGGATNNVGTLYVNGAPAQTSSAQNLVQALAGMWSTNGYTAASGGEAAAVRGVFVTYKLLSAADIARLYAAVQP